ncbi:MAG TPA: type II secretion system major pseudopilin GspG [Opitutales bacterium]|nr:type II secretion system major pseudopilin GspG [Opitutales bacterium]
MNATLIIHDKNGFPIRPLRAARGFTLTEILVAIALIVIIVAIAVVDHGKIIDGGQITAARLFANQEIEPILIQYRINTGNLPNTEQGLRALVIAPEGVTGWNGPYVKNGVLPLDPWGHEYHYAYPGVHNPKNYDCWSAGPDGISGTADDVGNW